MSTAGCSPDSSLIASSIIATTHGYSSTSTVVTTTRPCADSAHCARSRSRRSIAGNQLLRRLPTARYLAARVSAVPSQSLLLPLWKCRHKSSKNTLLSLRSTRVSFCIFCDRTFDCSRRCISQNLATRADGSLSSKPYAASTFQY